MQPVKKDVTVAKTNYFTLLLGILLVLAGIAAGLYVGVWFCFIGGIVAVVEAFKCDPVEAMGVALGVLRVVSSGLCGWLSCLCLLAPGAALLKSS